MVGLLVTASLFIQLPVSRLYMPAAALVGSAAAVAVALRSGGWLAAVALGLLGLAYGFTLVCQSNAGLGGASCGPGPFFSAHVGELVGASLGIPIGLAIKEHSGRSRLLLAAAIIAIAIPALRVVFGWLGPVTGSDAYDRLLWTIRLEAAAAFAAGAVLGATARRSGWGLLLIGAALLLPWLAALRTWWEDRQFMQAHGIDLNFNVFVQIEWQRFLPLIYFALVLLGFASGFLVSAVRRNISERRVRNSDASINERPMEGT